VILCLVSFSALTPLVEWLEGHLAIETCASWNQNCVSKDAVLMEGEEGNWLTQGPDSQTIL